MTSDLITKYIEEINFEPIAPNMIREKLESLESKSGLIIEADKTDLLLFRELSIHSILGVNTVMESLNSFVVMDSFGMQM